MRISSIRTNIYPPVRVLPSRSGICVSAVSCAASGYTGCCSCHDTMARTSQTMLSALLAVAAGAGVFAPGARASGAVSQAQCSSDLDCSLNGHCTGGLCQCDKPWTGVSCGELKCPVCQCVQIS
jgi:hypothetical protein